MSDNDRRKYALRKDGPVSITAFIGFAQHGHISVFLGTNKLAEGFGAVQIGLGDADGLQGQTLVVGATVLDIRAETDMTGVTTVVQGAGSQETLHSQANVEPGGKRSFLHVVDFRKGE